MKLDLTLIELNHLWKSLEHYGTFHGEVMKSIKEQVDAQLSVPVAEPLSAATTVVEPETTVNAPQ